MRAVATGWMAVVLVACEAPQVDGNGEARATRAEAWPAAEPADVESVDAILSALYSAISFPPHAADDPEPDSRGVNSIQLARGEGRWWVLHIAWDVERTGPGIPPELERP